MAKSNFTGGRYREAVYRSLRELAMSYFNIYFNLRGERTLRRYSRLVNLRRFDARLSLFTRSLRQHNLSIWEGDYDEHWHLANQHASVS